jgi:hypothetical protein
MGAMLRVLEKLLYPSGRGTFEGRMTAALSRVSAAIICAAYLLIMIDFTLEYGFIFDPKVIDPHISKFSDMFNSLWIIIIVTLVSITSVMPGLAALFLGLIELRTKHGKKTALWGFFGFFVGAVNFYIMFKLIAPS